MVSVTDLSQNSSMRYLTVVRHAKSSPAKPGESDFARTLNKRGREECERLREWRATRRTGPLRADDRPRELGRSNPRDVSTAFHGTAFVEQCEFSELIYNGRRDVSAEDLLIDLAAIDPVTTSLLSWRTTPRPRSDDHAGEGSAEITAR